jgi:hypothetical protein
METLSKIRVVNTETDYSVRDPLALHETNTTLSVAGMAADAKAVGDRITDEVSTLSEEINVERKRIDNLIASSGENTVSNDELLDIRTGFDGTIYDSAGNAVREQVKTNIRAFEQKVSASIASSRGWHDFLDMPTNYLYRFSSDLPDAFGMPVYGKSGTLISFDAGNKDTGDNWDVVYICAVRTSESDSKYYIAYVKYGCLLSDVHWEEISTDIGQEVLDSISSAVARATNIGQFITLENTVLDINTKTDTITLNNGYLHTRAGVIRIEQSPVARNTSDDMSLVVYDSSLKKVMSIAPSSFTDAQTLIAILTKSNPTSENANYVPGVWSVDGVLAPTPIGLDDVREELNKINGAYIVIEENKIEITTDASGQIVEKIIPIDLNDYNISNNSIVYFKSNTIYYIKPCDLSGINHITFNLGNAIIHCTGKYFLKAEYCDHMVIQGGTITGTTQEESSKLTTQYVVAEDGIRIFNSKSITIRQTCVANIGSQEIAGGTGIYFSGDCTGFIVDQCEITNIIAGQISDVTSDNWIHAYGVFVNRHGSDYNLYSRYGLIRNCKIIGVKGIDQVDTSTNKVTKKADGDGIFIQQLPYKDSTDGTLKCLDSNIVIEGCTFDDCYKRGVKATSRGVHVKNCHFSGSYWFAPLEFQYGHGLVENCHIVNNHAPRNINNGNDSDIGVVSGVVVCDGGMIVRDSYINCMSNNGCTNGIQFNTRNNRTPFTANDPWESCVFERVTFDGVDRMVQVYGANNVEYGACRIKGVDIIDCRIQNIIGNYAVNVGVGIFDKIDSLRFIDFRFDQGDSRHAIKENNANFSYPINCSLSPTYTYELYSKYWYGEPTISYGNIPTPPNTRIIYCGDMGGIRYKEYTGYGSRIYGMGAPDAITGSTGLNLLYSSKKGDEYTHIGNGHKFRCTESGFVNGDNKSIGTWVQV